MRYKLGPCEGDGVGAGAGKGQGEVRINLDVCMQGPVRFVGRGALCGCTMKVNYLDAL